MKRIIRATAERCVFLEVGWGRALVCFFFSVIDDADHGFCRMMERMSLIMMMTF
jgi:hypothetical protein